MLLQSPDIQADLNEEALKTKGKVYNMGVTGSSMKRIYEPIHGDDTDAELYHSLKVTASHTCRKSHVCLIAPWIASTLCLSLITGYLICQQTYAYGSAAFPTDLRDAHPYVMYEERVFSGKLAFSKENGKVYRDIDSSQPQYFGLPSPDIDNAWADILRGEFVRMTDEEAGPYTPDLNKSPFSHHYHFE
ncbi:hypothetical protein N7466_010393 [Penicillium verhagenii]|uniref:uncharacterized protein n=1 Tax=Penicillium verhagenii TaxID=1562060 RepID=UPI002545BCCD|nr:uncharacterized protein N7466_010393 [Penicillium verhagenii]KAJ5919450.1 hypothetical protein N7466_010393 [Penicillium verhagenii]